MTPSTANPTDEAVTFTWNGQDIHARPGEPIAVALWRSGIKLQTRSIKFHRPRGPQCMTGDCPGCMVRVDGVPNVRGCQTPAADGLTVEGQVGIPSVERDVLSMVDRVFNHFDHERTFTRPRIVREIYQAIARNLAGFGQPPTGELQVRQGTHYEPELLVIGGGPAGLAAANHAGRSVSVLHVDEDGFGGSLKHTPRTIRTDDESRNGPALAQALLAETPDTVTRLNGTVFGIYDDLVTVLEHDTDALAVHTATPETVILATGATEGAALIDGNDLPGVLGARAARILLNRYNLAPGDRTILIDPGRQGHAFRQEATAQGLTIETIEQADAIEGNPEVHAVRTPKGRIEADAVIVDPGLTPAPELGRQAGIPYTYQASLGGRVPLHDPSGRTPVPDVYVAGSCAGIHTPEGALLQGGWAGEAAAGTNPETEPEQLLETLTRGETQALEEVWKQR